MRSRIFFILVFIFVGTFAFAQLKSFRPVTQNMLENPSPGDWLMFSRTYDAQRFSPLTQINKQNVAQLRLAWERGMGGGQTETIPIV
jgi:quinoprotein glucose dehydrogenase